MATNPPPLTNGFVLNERFQVQSVLGRGGFGIVYLANDLRRKDQVVVKELAYEGATRSASGVMLAPDDGPRLRERFLDEARTIARLNVPGVLPVRASFSENGTAYYVTQYLADARTLDSMLNDEGRMATDGALDLFFQLLETLEAVHSRGVLHRDIKPTNILVTAKGNAYLIDFGSAREWHAASIQSQTIVFTPGYAPPEQLSDKAKRGPATDLYGLCATLYHMLAGQAPLPATDRMAGVPMRSLRQIRPDVEEPVLRAIEAGLDLQMANRPQSVEELRAMFADQGTSAVLGTLEQLDRKLIKLRSFTFEKRACPSCGGLLSEPKPLRTNGCPVCRQGIIRSRHIPAKLCPICRNAPLRKHDNVGPFCICPKCSKGRLVTRRKTLFRKQIESACPDCGAIFDIADASMSEQGSRSLPFSEWRAKTNREGVVWLCDGCEAQFDELADGRLKQVVPKPTNGRVAFHPDEWSRIAMGLDPGAGNAACDACGADYYVEGQSMTLLGSDEDPHEWAADYMGRRLDREAVRWLAVHKQSENPGYVCESCRTEFDREGDYLRLVQTPNRLLGRHTGEPKKLSDWHRIANGLPEANEEPSFLESMDDAVADAYATGEFGMEGQPELAWKGPAVRVGDGAKGNLSITDAEIVFGGLLRKWRAPTDAILDAWGEENLLSLQMSGESEPLQFEVQPVYLVAHLSSGDRSVLVDAERLAARVRNR